MIFNSKLQFIVNKCTCLCFTKLMYKQSLRGFTDNFHQTHSSVFIFAKQFLAFLHFYLTVGLSQFTAHSSFLRIHG
jgi:hypothetical protein